MAITGQFEKGHAGGPGRPKQKPLLEWCKKWTLEKAESVLGPIAEDREHDKQLEAIKTIMAYGVGKPVEFTETTHQFEGVAADPHGAKELLGQLIAGYTITSIGLGDGSGVVPPELAAQILNPEWPARAGDSGDRKT